MKQRDLKFCRRLLERRIQELTSDKIVDTADPGHFPDPTDRASLESHRNFTLRIRDRERKLILKIEEALKRLEEGSYGVCEACGDKIGIARLKARPVTTLCIECKSSQEVEEKRLRSFN